MEEFVERDFIEDNEYCLLPEDSAILNGKYNFALADSIFVNSQPTDTEDFLSYQSAINDIGFFEGSLRHLRKAENAILNFSVSGHWEDRSISTCPVWPHSTSGPRPAWNSKYYEVGGDKWWIREYWGDSKGNIFLWCASPTCWRFIYIDFNNPGKYKLIALCLFEPGRVSRKVFKDKNGDLRGIVVQNTERRMGDYGSPYRKDMTRYAYIIQGNQFDVRDRTFNRDGSLISDTPIPQGNPERHPHEYRYGEKPNGTGYENGPRVTRNLP